jgi:hypothetical protein
MILQNFPGNFPSGQIPGRKPFRLESLFPARPPGIRVAVALGAPDIAMSMRHRGQIARRTARGGPPVERADRSVPFAGLGSSALAGLL